MKRILGILGILILSGCEIVDPNSSNDSLTAQIDVPNDTIPKPIPADTSFCPYPGVKTVFEGGRIGCAYGDPVPPGYKDN